MAVKKNLAEKNKKRAINRALRREQKAKEAQERRHAAPLMARSLILAIGNRQQYAAQP